MRRANLIHSCPPQLRHGRLTNIASHPPQTEGTFGRSRSVPTPLGYHWVFSAMARISLPERGSLGKIPGHDMYMDYTNKGYNASNAKLCGEEMSERFDVSG